MRTTTFFTAILLLLLVLGCAETDIPLPDPESGTDLTESISPVANAIPTYPLNWENIDYMPTPPGVPRILVPWASGASRQFTFELANDYRKANGWELVYNTFNSTVLEDKLYFVLYNKYSGLLRMYMYIPSTGFIPSANMIHTLEIEGSHSNNSPILNFSDQVIVDVNTKSQFASIVEKAQVAPGTWYAFQHELAYDRDAATQTSSSFFLRWPVRAAQITQINLNGVVEGSLTGSVSVPGINFSLASSITNNTNTSRNGIIKLTGSGDSNDLSKLGQAFFSGAKKALEKAGSGIVEGIFNGIMGKNSNSNSDNVNLAINASINLKGTLEQNFLLDARTFSVPGVNQSQLIGFAPAYDEPLGVFYISGRPTIREKHYIIPRVNQFGQQLFPDHKYTYQVESGSFQFYFNPEVLAIADIRNIKREVILNETFGTYPIHGRKEYIGGFDRYTGNLVGTDTQRGSIVGARIVFDVVPKDGSPKITISKTFKANRATTTIQMPVPQPGKPGEEPW